MWVSWPIRLVHLLSWGWRQCLLYISYQRIPQLTMTMRNIINSNYVLLTMVLIFNLRFMNFLNFYHQTLSGNSGIANKVSLSMWSMISKKPIIGFLYNYMYYQGMSSIHIHETKETRNQLTLSFAAQIHLFHEFLKNFKLNRFLVFKVKWNETSQQSLSLFQAIQND